MKANKYILLNLFLWTVLFVSHAQIQEGEIVFERKTNLFKKFTDKGTQNYIKEENKYRKELFHLYFNDSMSVFVPEENLGNDRLSFTTNTNSVIQNLAKDESRTIYSYYGASIFVRDSLIRREWKLTDKYRMICNYECMQAEYSVNDSVRIYAWFTTAITPEVGPESYCNLPGAILGLATEDGSVTYFAKSIEIKKIDLEEVAPKFSEKKAKTRQEVIEKVKKDYRFEKNIDEYINDFFLW